MQSRDSTRIRIYIARPIDGCDATSVNEIIDRAKRDFEPMKFEVIDPTSGYELGTQTSRADIVAEELQILRSCDFLMVDMSRPNHTYIGCVAELVYAHLWALTTVVYVGQNSELRERPWLRYHADHIDAKWIGAVEWIQERVR